MGLLTLTMYTASTKVGEQRAKKKHNIENDSEH